MSNTEKTAPRPVEANDVLEYVADMLGMLAIMCRSHGLDVLADRLEGVEVRAD